MKSKKFNLAIIMMVVAAFISVAVVSCKKEDNRSLAGQVTPKPAFTPPQVDDMNAYLKNFKQKMQSATKDSNETLSIDEAAWYLACLANIDLCNASVEFNNVRFDTIEMQVMVNVNREVIDLCELCSTYNQMIQKIKRFEDSLELENPNLRFVDVLATKNGNFAIILMTTTNAPSRNLYDNYWYFPDTFGYLDSICYFQFSDLLYYKWNTTAKSELERVINVFEGRVTPFVSAYIPTRTISFDFPQWLDPYGSPFDRDSRLSVGNSINYYLMQEDMCYCLDSYLGLGIDYLANNYFVDNEYPIYWTISPIDSLFQYNHLHTYYHRLNVRYGQPATAGINPTPND